MENISFLGDVAFNGLPSINPSLNSERFILPHLLLLTSEIVCANLEVPVKKAEGRNEQKRRTYHSLLEPTRFLLKYLNIGCVSLANNHIYDCKMPGLRATIEMLDEEGIKHTGAGWLKSHIEPVIINSNGCKLAFISYVDNSTNPYISAFPELLINIFEEEKAISDIHAIKKVADIIIFSIHWGTDYSFYPQPVQKIIARKLIDAGASVIMGHHPHTFQPFEKYNGAWIFYSLGGLTFGDYRRPDGSMHALYRRTKKSAIVSLNTVKNEISFTALKELKGNFIVRDKKNYISWSHNKWIKYRIKNSSQYMVFIFNFYEKVVSRVIEYFFGYYQRPLKRLLQISNLHKIKRLLSDI